MIEHTQRCPSCRYVGPVENVHGKYLCPDCKQPFPFGDCCQGRESSFPQDVCDIKEEDVPK